MPSATRLSSETLYTPEYPNGTLRISETMGYLPNTRVEEVRFLTACTERDHSDAFSVGLFITFYITRSCIVLGEEIKRQQQQQHNDN